MTSTTLSPTAPTSAPLPAPATARRIPRRHAVADAVTMTWRNLVTYVRLPQLLVFSTIQPIMLVLLFRYVFGDSINLSNPTIDYVDYLMPGVFVQATVFGALGTGVGLAEDLHKGLVERFRSLPMARSAVLAGRTIADATRNAFVLVLMTAVGVLWASAFTAASWHTSQPWHWCCCSRTHCRGWRQPSASAPPTAKRRRRRCSPSCSRWSSRRRPSWTRRSCRGGCRSSPTTSPSR